MPSSPQPSVPSTTVALDLTTDVTTIVAAICDVESVSRNEAALADLIEDAGRRKMVGLKQGGQGRHDLRPGGLRGRFRVGRLGARQRADGLMDRLP